MRTIEAANTPNMKSGKRSELMNKYVKLVFPDQKNGTINDRERLKKILARKK